MNPRTSPLVALLASLAILHFIGITSTFGAAVPPTDNTSAPFMGIYEWGLASASGINRTAFSTTWLSRSQLWAEDFAPYNSWDQIRGQSWLLDPAQTWITQNTNRKYILSVGMLPGPWDGSGPTEGTAAGVPVSLALGASGAYNSHWQALAQNLVAKGLANNTILRIGWEFNGTWFTWRADTQAKATSYAAYWQQIVNTMRAVPGAQNLKFCWNGNNGWSSYALSDAYPGDAYVDFIGVDLYDQSWAANSYPYPANATPAQILTCQQNAWADISGTTNNGLAWWKNFATARGKYLSIPEWGSNNRSDGHGGLDNTFYIQQMYNFIQEPANNVYFHVYFNVEAPDGAHQLTPYNGFVTQFPNAATLFRQLFSFSATILFENAFGNGTATDWSSGTTSPWSVFPDNGDNVYNCAFQWNSIATNTAGNASWTNYQMDLDLKFTQMEPWSYAYIYGRYVDANNHYSLSLAKTDVATQLKLTKKSGGTATTLATVNYPLNLNTWYAVTLLMDGSHLEAKLNGASVINVQDNSPLGAGKIALGALKQGFRVDNVTVSLVPKMLEENLTDGVADGWTPSPTANWSVVSDGGNMVYKFDFDWNNQTGLSTAGTSSWTNYTLSTDFKITDLQSWSETYFYLRYTDSNNHYYVRIQDQGGTRILQLRKKVNGTVTNLGSYSATINAGTWYNISIGANASNFVVKLNGTSVIQISDSSLNAGKIGLGAWKQDVLYDNITVNN